LGIGLAAAGAGAAVGFAAERLAVGRPMGKRQEQAKLPGEEDLGTLRSLPIQVTSDDGTRLYAEVDEPEDWPAAHDAEPTDHTEPAEDGGRVPPRLTVVFCHGYCLTLDAWHYQRLSLRGDVRVVFWDQRGHGRSERGDAGSASVAQLGADLEAVLAITAPDGPLVLVGHSMGGMTIMSLAARRPDLIADRVAGVALLATSSGGLAQHDLGLRGLGKLVNRAAPGMIGLVARRPGWVDRVRRIGSDLEEVIVQRWSYASPVSPELLDFTAQMIATTRLDVIRDFMPELTQFEARDTVRSLAPIPALVLAGDRDLMVPHQHSVEIAEKLPQSRLVLVNNANHLVMLERPDIVTKHLRLLVDRARVSLRSAAQ
jgi:pimeloyl-ACP methyl ester carboxylesterase